MPEIPIKPGDAISTNVFRSYGSVGCFVRPDSDKLKGPFLLTNCHVIADEQHRVLMAGNTKVFHGKHNDSRRVEIGVVYKALREFNHKVGYVDWALVQITNQNVTIGRTVVGDGSTSLTKWADPANSMGVAKRGATTGWTSGNVEDVNSTEVLDYVENYPNNAPTGKRLLEITGHDFSEKGDSGSVIYDRSTKKIVALLFASDEQIKTLAIPFRRVLASMKDKTKYDWELA
jgi:hypothetical protein